MYTYWRHIWTGTCHRALLGREWGMSIFEPITKSDYDDWVLMQQHQWTWTPDQLRELKQLDEFGKVQDA